MAVLDALHIWRLWGAVHLCGTVNVLRNLVSQYWHGYVCEVGVGEWFGCRVACTSTVTLSFVGETLIAGIQGSSRVEVGGRIESKSCVPGSFMCP